MSSLFFIRLSNILLCCLFLYSCTSEPAPVRVFPKIDPTEYPLFHPAFVAALDEAPLDFPEPWNRVALKKLGIHTICMFSKGGKNPDDTLDKVIFSFSKDWSQLHYRGFKFDETRAPWTNGGIAMTADAKNGEIYFSRHLGISKERKTIIQATADGFLCLRKRANSRFDTTWFYGTPIHPRAVINKIGKTLFSIDLYIKSGSSTTEISNAFHQLPFSPESISHAQCSVIFTVGGRPTQAFLLNEQFVQIIRTRAWTYNTDHTIAAYREWLGNSIIKQMNWKYGETMLPERLIVNRKTYFYHYQ